MTPPPAPAELAFLTDVIGAEATLALIEAFAGTRVYVPSRVRVHGPLAKAVGQEAAAALADVHGGCYIVPPAAKRWRTSVYRERGLSYAKIALRIGVSEHTVWRYLASAVGTRASSGQKPHSHAKARANEGATANLDRSVCAPKQTVQHASHRMEAHPYDSI